MLNGEWGIPGRPKVVRGSKAPVLTSHAGLNPRSKSGYEPERRVINHYDSHGHDTASYARVYQTRAGFHTPTHASNYLQTDGQLKLAAVFFARR